VFTIFFMNRYFLTVLFIFIHCLYLMANVDKISDLNKKINHSKDTAKINALIELTKIYATTNLNKADSLSEISQQLMDDLEYPQGEIKNLNLISFIKSSMGQYKTGFESIEKAIGLSKEIDDKRLLAESYSTLFSYYFMKGDNESAMKPAMNALELSKELQFKNILAKSYDNVGILHGIKGKHTEAIDYFIQSLELYEELDEPGNISRALMHIGHTFELAGNYTKALEYLKRSIIVNKKAGDKYNEGWALVNTGVVYSRLNKVDTALVYYEKALVIGEQINNQRLILTCLDNIGGKYTLMGDFDNANFYLQKAFQLSEKSGMNSRTIYIMGNLAENFLYMGKFDSARIYGEKQRNLAIEQDLISEQKVAYFNLAQIYDSLGDYKKAHRSLLEYIKVNDTIFSRQKSEQIEELRESYETEKKEQEIANLTTINANQEFRTRTYGAAALTILLFAGILFYIQRIRITRNRALLEKEKELDRMKSRFFANISHEFRTPLTLIHGPIDDLIHRVETPDIKRNLSVIKRNTGRLLDLVNQLLDLSKIESGKLKLNISEHEIVHVIRGVAMSFHSLAEQKKIDFMMDISPESLSMDFDREKMEIILSNLLSNAFKFTPENGTITVSSEIVDNNRSRNFKVIISDSGQGIPANEVDQVFNRFYQSENSELRQHEGSGIGLALTKELVELHRGKIKVNSELGCGTSFEFEIPIKNSSNKTIDRESGLESKMENVEMAEMEEIAVSVDENNKSKNQLPVLLVIEDHQDVRNYIRDILKNDFSIQMANDGDEGIKKAIDVVPDLIISDVMMPKKNGYEVCRTLKNHQATSHIPIILLTAKADSEAVIEGLETKADDYVTKPFIPKQLFLRVKNMIEARKRLKEKYQKNGVLKPSEITENSVDEKFLNKLVETIENQLANEHFGVEQLSDEIGMSRSQLHRKLTALIDQSPNQFIRSFRLNRAHELLKKKVATASEIGYRVGFGSPSYFAKCYHEQFGYSPSETIKDPSK